jgi:hypothetical protein
LHRSSARLAWRPLQQDLVDAFFGDHDCPSSLKADPNGSAAQDSSTVCAAIGRDKPRLAEPFDAAAQSLRTAG